MPLRDLVCLNLPAEDGDLLLALGHGTLDKDNILCSLRQCVLSRTALVPGPLCVVKLGIELFDLLLSGGDTFALACEDRGPVVESLGSLKC